MKQFTALALLAASASALPFAELFGRAADSTDVVPSSLPSHSGLPFPSGDDHHHHQHPFPTGSVGPHPTDHPSGTPPSDGPHGSGAPTDLPSGVSFSPPTDAPTPTTAAKRDATPSGPPGGAPPSGTPPSGTLPAGFPSGGPPSGPIPSGPAPTGPPPSGVFSGPPPSGTPPAAPSSA